MGPVAIFALAFSGVTPIDIADLVAQTTVYWGGQLLQVVASVSQTWLGGPWFWVLLVFIIFAIMSCRGSNPIRLDPESEDPLGNLRKSRLVCQLR